MDYNSRMSQQFRSTTNQKRKKEDDPDAFMRLSDKEIAGCISDIGVPFSPLDLQKPNPQQIQQVFEWLAEVLVNATREVVEPSMRAASDSVCGDYSDIMQPEARNLMGFFVSLRRLTLECGITDFSFADLTKPTHDRLVKIFSYIINFVRFRESQTDVIDTHLNASSTTKARVETLYHENSEMETRLAELKQGRGAAESAAASKIARNDALKARLLELRKGQETVSDRLEAVRTEKARLTARLEDKTAAALAVKQEASKLRPYASQSPSALQASLADLSATLAQTKSAIDVLDKRSRALQTSSDSFSAAGADVAACVKALEDVSGELTKEAEEAIKAARTRDALAERATSVREVERTEDLLKRQAEKWAERTEKLRKGAGEKAEVARGRMEELRRVHKELGEERGERGREVEKRRVRIEMTEKKMVDLKERIEREVLEAREEFVKLDAHVRLYITEMEAAL
ncbi:MAG: kinetochore-associated Ndc80 complex subunit nuf2 [Vezdaea aestivalis]|nr:MAG: kinetochore-associated Ndc80 complex subunit nuf2 [Vezdaea aestivalis]